MSTPPHPPSPLSLRGWSPIHLPTHSHLTPLGYPFSPQDQAPPLPLKPDKGVLCYICSWTHRPAHGFGWWLSPWVFWWVQLLVTVILPMELESPSVPSVLSLTLPLGTPSCFQRILLSLEFPFGKSNLRYRDNWVPAEEHVGWCRRCWEKQSWGRNGVWEEDW
jgi:hypothetical protein